jgi:hypothetical protein
VGWLIGVIPTVVIVVAVPQLRDALAIATSKLCLFITGSFVANLLRLIRSIHAVGISVTLPGAKDAATRCLALELVFRTFVVTVFLVTSVPTVVPPIADCCDECAVGILALELALAALSRGTRGRLVRPVRAVHGTVALPVVRDALLVATTTSVLAFSALGNAGPVVSRVQNEVVRAGAGELGTLHVVGSEQTEVGAASVGERALAGVVILVLP